MSFEAIETNGLVLLGCGKMGSALLSGWLEKGLAASAVHVIDPKPSAWLEATGVHLNADLPPAPAVMLLAIKPQMMGDALDGLQAYGGGGTLILSIAAGTPIARFEEVFGAHTPVIRAMPNTPAAVGRGVTALFANPHASTADMELAQALLSAVGETVTLSAEAQMDAVTAVSGSGPAYVFHLIEAMAAAGEAEGLAPELAMQLARATVVGAGQLAYHDDAPAAELRQNVTSPGGTTAAALEILMDKDMGLSPLMRRAVGAAAARARELAE